VFHGHLPNGVVIFLRLPVDAPGDKCTDMAEISGSLVAVAERALRNTLRVPLGLRRTRSAF
jgi:hypothetical protein